MVCGVTLVNVVDARITGKDIAGGTALAVYYIADVAWGVTWCCEHTHREITDCNRVTVTNLNAVWECERNEGL